jgi:hypothetical protein
MTKLSQKRAVANDRRRLRERGMSRYEVRGLAADKELVRTVARRLAEGGAEAVRLRSELQQQVCDKPPARGGILAALRRSPLVGAGIRFKRKIEPGRDIEL